MIEGKLSVPLIKFGLTPEQELKVMDIAKKMFLGAKQLRTEHEADWRELGQYFIPHLVRINDTTKTKKSKWGKIINNTCLTAVRTNAAGMQSGLTSPARPWFRMGLEDDDLMEYAPVREWTGVVGKRMLNVLRRTNFYNTTHTMYSVLSTIGTAGQMSLFDFEDVLNFQNLMTGRYWVGVNAKKAVDRVFIELNLSVIQMVEMFGLDNIDPATRREYDTSNYFTKKIIMLAIYPNPFVGWDKGGGMLIASNQKKFISVYWSEGYQKPYKTSGFDRFPCHIPRWETTDDEEWGVGCGVVAIGDSKAMQLKEKEKAKGIQKMVTPPTSAPAEMRNGQFPISGISGGVTYRPPNTQADAIQPLYNVNIPLQYLWQDIQIDEDRVNKAFYADLFLMLAQSDRRDMTATEVAERHEEKLLALGPVIERLGNEFLDPVIERTFEVMAQNGLIPEPPPEIQGMPLKVEYISLLSQAQQQVGIGSIERFMSFTGSLAAIFPEVSDKVDADQAVDEVGNMLGVPPKLIVTDDKALEKRQVRAQNMQQQQQAQMGMAAVQAAEKMGKTPVGDSTMLNKMMGV